MHARQNAAAVAVSILLLSTSMKPRAETGVQGTLAPKLIPLYFSMWVHVETKACATHQNSVDSLKA